MDEKTQDLRRALTRVLFLMSGFIAIACSAESRAPDRYLYWSDADSGYIRGGGTPEVHFRLHGIDAPETRRNTAKCEREIELGFEAKEAIVEMTRGGVPVITRSYGPDFYNREVIDLTVDGQDVADALLRAGVAKPWDYDGGHPKPDWCE